MKKRIAGALMALVLIACPVWALFGIGDIVYDPTLYANALLILAELVKSYDQLKTEYDLQAWLAKTVPVDMSTRYRTVGAAWYSLQMPYDRFGNLGAWADVVNHGGSALGAYGSASLDLHPYGPRFSQLSAEEQRKSASQYASAELADGINVDSMQTIGMLRGNAPAVDRAIQGLENDSLSLDPAMNTEIGVLNKINAATIANLRSARDTNRALLSALEQQVADSKRRRDAEVSEINTQIMRLERGDEAKAENTSTLTDSLMGFRWR